LGAVVVSAADEEDPSIRCNVEWEALSNRTFDDLRYLTGLAHEKV